MKKTNFEKLIYPNKLSEIIFLEANKNNTVLHLSQGKEIVSGYNLKQYEKILEEYPEFLRVHRSYIINTEFLGTINEDFLYLKMQTEEVIPINFPAALNKYTQKVS